MKEIPILYSSEMIRAKLAGRKTVTRRLVKIKYLANSEIGSIHPDGAGTGWVAWSPRPVSAEETKRCYPGAEGFKCPYGQPGDVHWIKENHFQYGFWIEAEGEYTQSGLPKLRFIPVTNDVKFVENPPEEIKRLNRKDLSTPGWYSRSSLFLPKYASRIWERVINVKPERLHDITEEYAKREGATPEHHDSYIGAFMKIWREINGPESWEANPWVWRIQTETLSTTGRPENL